MAQIKITLQRVDGGQASEKAPSVIADEEAVNALLQAAVVGLEGGPAGQPFDDAWDLRQDLEGIVEGEL